MHTWTAKSDIDSEDELLYVASMSVTCGDAEDLLKSNDTRRPSFSHATMEGKDEVSAEPP
jgi:hypothetical protein